MSSADSGSGSDEQVRVGGAVESPPLAVSGGYRVLCLVGGAGRHTSAAPGRGGHRKRGRERQTRCDSEHALVMVVTQYT